MLFTGTHDEDMLHEDNMRAELAQQVEELTRGHRHAEYMRRDMIGRLDEVAKSRDFWDKEAARKLGELERCQDALDKIDGRYSAKTYWVEANSYLPCNSNPVMVFGVHRNGDIDRKVWLGCFNRDDNRWYAESGIEIGDVTHWSSRPAGPGQSREEEIRKIISE